MIGVSSWGRLDCAPHDVHVLDDRDAIAAELGGRPPALAYGMGRSYGDVCLNPGGLLWKTTALDRFVDFDRDTGVLRCEAGVALCDIQLLFVPRGWMLPVAPGTQLITVGGAIANDVHGKNHHRKGTFGDHVTALKLVRTDGATIDCGPDLRSDWFAATIGGLGLTGLIVEASIRLRRVDGPWLDTETIVYRDLAGFFDLADTSEADWEHTVSWFDCSVAGKGRGIFMRANPSSIASNARTERPVRAFDIPVTPPLSMINRLTLRPFNAAYYRARGRKAGRAIAHYENFLHPLDRVGHWNRIYGPRGFFQYQSVVPRAVGHEATQKMLATIERSGQGSFLAVLKTFGDRASPGLLGFARSGVSLALDFPNLGARTLGLFDALDAIVVEAGGRIYCAKDARMSRATFEAGYPGFRAFLPYRDPGLSSAMSRRLFGH